MAKQKPPKGGSSNSILMIADQAATSAGFDFPRYAMKPMPAKPRISIAYVEGSGTASARNASAINICAAAVG
jgi:hypothetical protein